LFLTFVINGESLVTSSSFILLLTLRTAFSFTIVLKSTVMQIRISVSNMTNVRSDQISNLMDFAQARVNNSYRFVVVRIQSNAGTCRVLGRTCKIQQQVCISTMDNKNRHYSGVIPYMSGITLNLGLSIFRIRAYPKQSSLRRKLARIQRIERPRCRVIPDMLGITTL